MTKRHLARFTKCVHKSLSYFYSVLDSMFTQKVIFISFEYFERKKIK